MKKIFKRAISLCIIAAMLISLVPCVASADTVIGIGEYVQMGTYYGEPILWRCVDIDENGPLMLADKILCVKSFDALPSANTTTGSHSRNRSYASNYWGDSNIRLWLNSTESAGNIEWLCGNPPTKENVWEGYNAYDNEAGFLSNFTNNERNTMKTVVQKSILSWPEYKNGISTTGTEKHEYYSSITNAVSNYNTAYAENVTDKIFLLDINQVNTVYNNSNILGDGYYIGVPTSNCVVNSEYINSDFLTGQKWHSWLRSPYSGGSNSVRTIDSSGNVYTADAKNSNVGVRPAFYLNTTVNFSAGSGTSSEPYRISSETVTPEPDITPEPEKVIIGIGEYVQMGMYYGEPILWRCVDIDENGSLMLADKILCIKPFDAQTSENKTTGSHSHSSKRASTTCRGSNYWGDSNIRSWLNSTAGAGNVEWLCGNPPTKEKVYDSYTAYDNEAGFLSSFTENEQNAIKEVSQKSLLSTPEIDSGSVTLGTEQHVYKNNIDEAVQNYDIAYAENVTDKMFLLDVKQVNKVYNNSNILGNNYYIGIPSEKCKENSECNDSSFAADKKWYYWLRSPKSDDYSRVRYIYSSGSVYDRSADSNLVGVRPAFYLDTLVKFATGSGTSAEPYKIDNSTLTTESNISMSYDDGILTVKSKEAFEANLYTAYFDENNAFVKCNIRKLSLKEGENTVTADDLTIGANVKLMLWNENIQPMCNSVTQE